MLMNKIYGLFNSFDCIILSKRITTKEFGTDYFAFLGSFFRDYYASLTVIHSRGGRDRGSDRALSMLWWLICL